MVGPRTALVTAAFVLALVVPPICQAFSASQTLRPTAKVCALLPIADLETLYGAAAGTPLGADASALSSCSVTIAGQTVKVASARAGTAGLPASVQAGLAAAGAMSASSKPGMTHESRDYGDVACRRVTATQDLDNKPLPRPAARRSS